jgi:hypothetical protein
MSRVRMMKKQTVFLTTIYVRKMVRNMIYQARVDAVKMYYNKKLNQKLDDKLARPIELKYEEYLEGNLKWCKKAI